MSPQPAQRQGVDCKSTRASGPGGGGGLESEALKALLGLGSEVLTHFLRE